MKASTTTTSGGGWVNTLAILVLSTFLGTVIGFGGYVVGTLAARDIYQTETHQARDRRPDIRHCFDPDVVLWDCIRHKETK